jgi:hypothetical protein
MDKIDSMNLKGGGEGREKRKGGMVACFVRLRFLQIGKERVRCGENESGSKDVQKKMLVHEREREGRGRESMNRRCVCDILAPQRIEQEPNRKSKKE